MPTVILGTHRIRKSNLPIPITENVASNLIRRTPLGTTSRWGWIRILRLPTTQTITSHPFPIHSPAQRYRTSTHIHVVFGSTIHPCHQPPYSPRLWSLEPRIRLERCNSTSSRATMSMQRRTTTTVARSAAPSSAFRNCG